MARNAKSTAKAERADRRIPRDERLDLDAVAGLLPMEELDRAPDSRLTLGDMKRAAAKAKGAMGTSKKLDPSLKTARTRDSGASSSGAVDVDGSKRSRGAAAARDSLDKGRSKRAAAESAPVRRTRSNAEIAENVTSTARRSPAPRTARVDSAAGSGGAKSAKKRTGSLRQRAPAPGNVTTVTKREAVTGQKQAKKTGVRSTSSTGGRKPPKRSARAGAGLGGSRRVKEDRKR
jgi:hypothetical protein